MAAETTTADAPSYWACYLINGDASGFDEGNTPDDPDCGDRIQRECDAWLAEIAADGWRVASCSDESHFARFRFAERGWLLTDLLEYTLVRDL